MEANLNERTDAILREWKETDQRLRKNAKDILDAFFADSDYDGIHLLFDGRRTGVDVETWIVFRPTQVKSATDNIGTHDLNNPDTLFSDNSALGPAASSRQKVTILSRRWTSTRPGRARLTITATALRTSTIK